MRKKIKKLNKKNKHIFIAFCIYILFIAICLLFAILTFVLYYAKDLMNNNYFVTFFSIFMILLCIIEAFVCHHIISRILEKFIVEQD